MKPFATVVIPAHNEASLIGENLRNIITGVSPGELETIVVCNGCTDNTAQVAQSVSPEIRVVEISTASKIAALNAGDKIATTFPRIYIDADISLSTGGVRALATALDTSQPRVAIATLHNNVERSSALVRSYYRAWERTPFRQGPGAICGMYAVNKSGRDRWGEFPDVIADDGFVMSHFAANERITVSEHRYSHAAPRTIRSVFEVRRRVYRGGNQLSALRPTESPFDARRSMFGVIRQIRSRRDVVDAVVYFAVNAAAKLAERFATTANPAWNRDDSSRAHQTSP